MSNKKSYHDIYVKSKLTTDELKKFPGFEEKSEEELSNIAECLYDLAVLFQKKMIENNE